MGQNLLLDHAGAYIAGLAISGRGVAAYAAVLRRVYRARVEIAFIGGAASHTPCARSSSPVASPAAYTEGRMPWGGRTPRLGKKKAGLSDIPFIEDCVNPLNAIRQSAGDHTSA